MENKNSNKDKGFLARRGRTVSAIAFISGFIWDGLTLTFVDLSGAAIILGIYLAVIAVGIIVYQGISVRYEKGWKRKFANVIPYVIQFMFGTLFNASLIFYTRSAELSGSWPFLLFLLAAVFSNEIFRTKQNHITFQIALFFLAEFLFLVFALPIAVGKIGSDVFIWSGLISLTVLGIVVFSLSKVAKERSLEARRTRIFIVILIYAFLNYGYFANLIPPIPLALKDAGVFHSVVKINGSYNVKYEPAPSYVFWRKEDKVFHQFNNAPVYIWSAVFAPSAFSLSVYHEWYYFDTATNQWALKSKTEFDMVGGRGGGYRGYSMKNNLLPGKWRVDITIGTGQRLGRVFFDLVSAATAPVLKTDSR